MLARGLRRRFTSRDSLPSLVLLNADRINFDEKLDFTPLTSICNITSYDITSTDEILDRVQGHSIILNKEFPLPSSIISQFPSSVKLITELGTGYNNLPLSILKSHSISVNNLPTYATNSMSQQTITSLLSLSSSLHLQLKDTTKKYLNQCHLSSLPHNEVQGKTLGLIGGLGNIGTSVSKIAHVLGMHVISTSSSKPVGHVSSSGVEVVKTDDLFKESDYVSIHCPLNEETKVRCREEENETGMGTGTGTGTGYCISAKL
ncbi:hypothetical protein TL16_g04550 [Triparma laevis f. inornata]|uniref:D-isomer specific 2-hydroxyacid dehydrogenase NAD-binding domain-containing protein n=1 Tax=Triparma laevis f. inornata TaxID=1714386 RepID=A0A9W7E621_9STRA|nr:hypothetical protein TL16_g04550 [Triparma laevis f. inornata]